MVSEDEVTKLYVATFNRAPDAAGLDYWVNNSGLALEQIAQSFFDQPETQNLYPSTRQTDSFVNSVYRNLFSRDAENDGMDYWVAELDSGRISKQNFILAVMNGALGTDATILTNKQAVGLSFARNNLQDVTLATSVMKLVDNTIESTQIAISVISSRVVSSGNISTSDISGLIIYNYDTDYEDSNFFVGSDAIWRTAFNADGSFVEERFTAPFGSLSSRWVSDLVGEPGSTWSVVNGRIAVHYNEGGNVWSDGTLTLVSRTGGDMLWVSDEEEIFTSSTSMLSPRSETQMASAGLVEKVFSGSLIFQDTQGNAIAVPENEKIRLVSDFDYSRGGINIMINADGTFSAAGKMRDTIFTPFSSVQYVVYQDLNSNGYYDANEPHHFGKETTYGGISAPQIVAI